jgi:endonuclease IV
MNERIKELAEKAEEVVFYSPSTGKETKEVNLEKFAELIVRECAELLKKESEEYYIVGSDYCEHKAEAFDEAVDLVKQHFGVKE